MLVGLDYHTLDGKGRVVMPARYRGALQAGCYVSKGRDRQLVIWTSPAFLKKGEEMDQLPDTPEARMQIRTFFGASDHQELDKAGRIMVKQELRDWAGLDLSEELALVGIGVAIEVWNRALYLAAREKAERSYLGEPAMT